MSGPVRKIVMRARERWRDRVARLLGRGRGDSRRFLLRLLPKHSVGCEIGVWQGDFSAEILRIVQPDALWLIDPWEFQPAFGGSWYGGSVARTQADMDRIHDGVVRRFARERAVHVRRMKTEAADAAILDHSLDWIYIDGNHEYSHVRRDLEFAERKVRCGGVIAGDDYDRGEGTPVTRAVADHLRAGTSRLEWVSAHQFWIRRMGTRGGP